MRTHPLVVIGGWYITVHKKLVADTARNYVKENEDYTLYSFDDSLSICFNYKDFDPVDLCTKLYQHNKLMIGFGYFLKQGFVRLVTINGENTNNTSLFSIIGKIIQ